MFAHPMRILGAVVIAFAATSCSDKGAGNDTANPLTAIGSGDPLPQTATLAKAYPGQWDRAVITCSHISGSLLKQELGFNWPDAATYGQLREDEQAVVLVKGRSVVRADRLDRAPVDLCGGSHYPMSLTPQRTLLLSKQTMSDGTTYVAARPKGR